MKWTNETPTKGGIYYFRDEHAAKKPGHAAWLMSVNPVRDESLGLYADCFYGVYDHLDIDDPLPMSLSKDMVAPLGKAGIILRSHPTLSHSPVANWQGEWWGPLPDMEHTTNGYTPMSPGLYQVRDEYASQEAGMVVWWAVVCEVQDPRLGYDTPSLEVVMRDGPIAPTATFAAATKLCAVFMPHVAYGFKPVDEIEGLWRGPFPAFDLPNAAGIHITADYLYPLDKPEDEQPRRILADTSAGDITIYNVPFGRFIDVRNAGPGVVRVLPSQHQPARVEPMSVLTVQATQWIAGESHGQ